MDTCIIFCGTNDRCECSDSVFFFENLKYWDCIMEKGSPEYALDGIDCSAWVYVYVERTCVVVPVLQLRCGKSPTISICAENPNFFLSHSGLQLQGDKCHWLSQQETLLCISSRRRSWFRNEATYPTVSIKRRWRIIIPTSLPRLEFVNGSAMG